MAKPRIFLSSTCYDLSDARATLTAFLESIGFEVLNSQDKKFGVKPKVHSHDACLAMMRNADYVVLIIGGRHGGNYIGSDKSITNEEVKAARKLGLPIFAFVDQKVEAVRPIYRKNPTADFSHAVDDNRVFDFIAWVAAAQDDNWLKTFDNVTDIQDALRAQFAYILLLYSQDLRKKPDEAKSTVGKLVGFPTSLEGVPGDDEDEKTEFRASLKDVYAALAKILRSGLPDGAKQEQLKALWVIARHGDAQADRLKAKEDVYAGYTWKRPRGERVFNQMEEFGVIGDYDCDEDYNGKAYGVVTVRFAEKSGEYPAEALQTWVKDLIRKYGDDEALDMFKLLDMSLYVEAAPAKLKATIEKPISTK